MIKADALLHKACMQNRHNNRRKWPTPNLIVTLSFSSQLCLWNLESGQAEVFARRA